MHALALALATVAAVMLAPTLLRLLVRGGHVRPNYRGRMLAHPFGILILVGALAALGPLALAQRLGVRTLHPQLLPIALYVLGVAMLGLIDDTLAGSPRGWREHIGAALGGELSTGMLKAVGSLGLALYSLSYMDLSTGRWLLASLVVTLSTNALNLLDLRPGRASKALAVLGAGLTLGTGELRALWTLGLFLGPALVAGAYDLRERAMLGDTGAGVLGALAGLWIVMTLSVLGQAIAASLLVILTVYGDLRSLGSLVERTPLLRELDSWGRPHGRRK